MIPSKDTQEKEAVKKIIGKRKNGKIVEYLVWFKREKKANALWISKMSLLEDGLDDYIADFEERDKIEKRKKKAKKNKAFNKKR